jgi:hypothetical protein
MRSFFKHLIANKSHDAFSIQYLSWKRNKNVPAHVVKGNNKITELRTIIQRES